MGVLKSVGFLGFVAIVEWTTATFSFWEGGSLDETYKMSSFILSAICYSGKSSARWMCSRRVGRLLGPAGIAVVASQCNDSILPTTAQQGSPPNEPVRGFSQLVLTVQLVPQSTGPHSELASQVNWASKDSFGLNVISRMSDPKLEVQGRESRPKDDKGNQI